MRMIVGLGNPGRKYAQTRHNAGFRVVDMLSETFGIEVGKRSFGARLGKGVYAGQEVLLLKPWRYMNCSGGPAAGAVGFYRVKLSDVLVVLDDMWLEPGQIRLRAKGSAGGHNGLADVIEKLGTENFPRLRVGIGQAPADGAVDYVLGKPGGKGNALMNEGLVRAKEAAICWLEEGTGAAMTKFNTRTVTDDNTD